MSALHINTDALTETALHLEIYGHVWAGYRATYQYNLPPGTVVADATVKTFAPDFASVLDWRLVRAEHRYENTGRGMTRRSDTYRTLRGWRNGMTCRRFYRLANGS